MRINELVLYDTDVGQHYEFYTGVLDLDGSMSGTESCTINIGHSKLTFKQTTRATHYHFAINIPNGSATEALNWLRNKCEVIESNGSAIVRFEDWKADAIYFRDPNGNIVELIAREAVLEKLTSPFGPNALLGISEVGIGSDDPEAIHRSLNDLPLYSGDHKRFCALGDPEGLLVVANPKMKTWFPTGDEIKPSDLIVKGDHNFRFSDGTIHKIN